MAGQQKSPHEEFILTFFTLFIIGGISFVIWKLFRYQLTEMLRWIRVAELYLVNFIHGGDFTVVIKGAGTQKLKTWIDWLPGADVRDITIDYIKIVSLVAVPPLRVVFVGFLALMALWAVFFGPGTHYRRRMKLEDLMREQAKSFPAIQPFLKFDPRSLPYRAPGQPVPEQLPLFSEALSPEEWLAYHEIRMVGGQIDINRAWGALQLQLGRRWQGPLKLAPHAQALFAAFALKHSRKRKESEALINELSLSWTADKGFRPSLGLMRRVRKIIKNPKLGGALAKHADQHAYETTALLKSLARARQEGGVLAPAEFLWLRGHDRALWYPLNNLGRKSYHAEAAGAMVHYTNELIAGQKIPTPRFEEVIRGIEAYMKSGSARSIPELAKKSGGRKE